MTIYLADYQTFTTVAEMDLHLEKHVLKNYQEMNDTDRALVSLLAQYACKYPGAAHLKVETICTAVNKSEATVRRTLRKLEKLAIIRKVSTIRRVSKGYGANIILILPFDDQSPMIGREDVEKLDIPSAEAEVLENETDISLISKKELLHNTYSSENVSSAHSVDNFLEKQEPTFYQRFKSAIFALLGQDQKLVSHLYGVYRSLTYRVTQLLPHERAFYESIGYEALMISLHAAKQKKIRNLAGYYSGVFEKMVQRDLFEFFAEHE